MMLTQGSSLATGAHGLFQKFAIQAITLEGIQRGTSRDSGAIPVTLLQVGRIVEGVFRSLNNLLEKFNRSFWFYLLPSTRRYVSIGYYMIPFGLMTVPLILRALQLYLKLQSQNSDGKDGLRVKGSSGSISKALFVNFMSHMLGLMVASIPLMIQRYGSVVQKDDHYRIATADFIYFSIVAFCLICICNPLKLIRGGRSGSSNHRQKDHQQDEARASEFLALLNLSLLFACISLINISLAFGLTLLYTPLILISVWCSESSRRTTSPTEVVPLEKMQEEDYHQETKRSAERTGGDGVEQLKENEAHESSTRAKSSPSSSGSASSSFRLKYFINRILLIILHPVFVHYLCLFGMSLAYDFSGAGFFTHMERAFGAQKKTILYFIEDWFIYGNWTFLLGSVFLFPIWLQFWYA